MILETACVSASHRDPFYYKEDWGILFKMLHLVNGERKGGKKGRQANYMADSYSVLAV